MVRTSRLTHLAPPFATPTAQYPFLQIGKQRPIHFACFIAAGKSFCSDRLWLEYDYLTLRHSMPLNKESQKLLLRCIPDLVNPFLKARMQAETHPNLGTTSAISWC